MKTALIIMTTVFVLILTYDISIGIVGHYQYEKQFGAYWSLSEKASTIPQKSEYLDRYINALEQSGMAGKYNAIWLITPDNSFDYNMLALKSLQLRLHDIKNMDVSSFQYQTAIQQITAQEQGEAMHMNEVFAGIWWMDNHFLLWDWVLIINLIALVVL